MKQQQTHSTMTRKEKQIKRIMKLQEMANKDVSKWSKSEKREYYKSKENQVGQDWIFNGYEPVYE